MMKPQRRWICLGVLGLAIALIRIGLLDRTWNQYSIGQTLMMIAESFATPEACLPEGIQMKDVVSAEIVSGTANTVKTLTVEEKLRQLQATCRQQQLVDASGKAIRFYRLQGCWGNPPSNMGEIMQQQAAEIQYLKATFTLIEMTCNPTGIPYP